MQPPIPVKTPPKMKIVKPYKLGKEPPAVAVVEEMLEFKQQLPAEAMKQFPPSPSSLPPNIIGGSQTLLPYPPPNMLYLYQMVPAHGQPKPHGLPPPEAIPPGPPGPPGPQGPQGPHVATLPAPPPTTTPGSKTKPRTVHEYYDQHGFQWREFNPEDTVVGDESDPFIVYFRYQSKSIGARRTPWILAKHVKLIKIMQDCLPDFDWRTGEDLLVYHSN